VVDPDVDEDKQVVPLTAKMYNDLIYNAKSSTPWFIVFVRTKKSEERFFHSHHLVNVLKVLADEYQGKIRFAWVNILEEECLKESFGVRALPQNFYIKDGMVYEMQSLSLNYS